MKLSRLLLSLFLCLAFFWSGCATATRVHITAAGKTVEVVFPKNLTAEKLDFDLDPATGELRFRATRLRSDGSKVIESTGAAFTDAAKSLLPIEK